MTPLNEKVQPYKSKDGQKEKHIGNSSNFGDLKLKLDKLNHEEAQLSQKISLDRSLNDRIKRAKHSSRSNDLFSNKKENFKNSKDIECLSFKLVHEASEYEEHGASSFLKNSYLTQNPFISQEYP